jgi:2-polyprenyl-6-methoxyphenol hydroxylase-like FAD-dependent oxidoreductase
MKKLNCQTPILVAGAGVAGLAICYWFEKMNCTLKLIEKEDALSENGFAVDIRGSAVNLM